MSLEAITQSPGWLALGSAVVHFLWQGALIGALTALVLGALRQRSSATRCAVATGALMLCLATFVATFLWALASHPALAREGALQLADAGGAAGGVSAARLAGSATLRTLEVSGIAAWLWAAGALFMAARLGLDARGVRRLRTTAVSEPGADWQVAFAALRQELGVTRAVRLLRSGLAEVPMVVGWLSPVVLVPAAAFTALSPGELRALLAHELAHIRRHDHLFNAVQAVVEVVLFFHPAVWWISRELRAEREYSCDESSVRVVGDPRLLAEALAAVEMIRITTPRTSTVLAADGGPLMQRITRILGVHPDARTLSSWQLPAALAGVLAVAGTALAAPDSQESRVAEERVVEEEQAGRRADVERVQAELQEAVTAGKITQQQADERLEGYLRHQEAAEAEKRKREAEREEAHAKYVQVEFELQELVKAGEITQEQAAEKLAALRGNLGTEREEAHAKYAQVELELQELVKAGEITQAQAEERLAGFQRRLALHDRLRVLEEKISRIQEAVHAGEMTPEEAHAAIAGIKERMAAGAAERVREDPEAVIREIEAAVAAGKLTPEDGRAKIAGYKERLALARAVREYENTESYLRAVQADVEAGKLTPEEGVAKIAAFEKLLAERRAAEKREDPEAVLKKIQAAVEAGKMTREEAEAHVNAWRIGLAAQEVVYRGRDPKEVLATIHAGVESGDLTPEEARMLTELFEQHLDELKRERAAREAAEKKRAAETEKAAKTREI